MDRLSPGLTMLILTVLGLALRLVWFGRYQLAGTDCDGAGYMDVAHHILTGAGFTTGIFKYLYLPPAHLPQPDAHWNPLYPYLTAGAFRLFGESLFAAKLVPLLLGSAVPAMVYLLGRALTGEGRVAIVAGLAAVAHPLLVTWSLRIETEMGTILLVTAVFVMMSRPGRRAAVALGVVAGLAWWMKYPSGLVWGAILLQTAIMRPQRRSLRDLAIVALAFAATVAPWLLRNLLVFGDPFYSELRTDLVASYPGLGGINQAWASPTAPPKPIPFMLTHSSVTLHYICAGLREFRLTLPREFSGSLLLMPFALAGVFAEARRWRAWAPPVLFGVLLLAVFSASFPKTRYLYGVVPLFIVLASSGVVWLAGRAAALPRRPAAAARAVVVLLALAALADLVRMGAHAATDRNSAWGPGLNYCALEYLSVAPYIREHARPRDAVMASEVYHAGYLFGRPAVNMPFDERLIPPLCAKYGIRYLVVSDLERGRRLPAWSKAPPAWARVVLRRTADQIARAFGAGGYAYLSPVTIYELDLQRPPGGAPAP